MRALSDPLKFIKIRAKWIGKSDTSPDLSLDKSPKNNNKQQSPSLQKTKSKSSLAVGSPQIPLYCSPSNRKSLPAPPVPPKISKDNKPSLVTSPSQSHHSRSKSEMPQQPPRNPARAPIHHTVSTYNLAPSRSECDLLLNSLNALVTGDSNTTEASINSSSISTNKSTPPQIARTASPQVTVPQVASPLVSPLLISPQVASPQVASPQTASPQTTSPVNATRVSHARSNSISSHRLSPQAPPREGMFVFALPCES